MANTLKFGNGEWYGKEGTILAYNDLNSNYKPLPFNFSRASSATVINKDGLIETVGSGQPRIDYKDDSKGALLLEPTRSNLITYSEDFSQWFKLGGATLTSNYSVSPDGTQNSSRMQMNVSDKFYINVALNGDISFAVYLKGVGQIRLRDNTSTGLKDVTLTSEWVRYELNFNATISNFQIEQQTGVSDFEIFGAQLEQGSYATSYIPTQGSAVTRLRDLSDTQNLSHVIGQTEGVIFYDAILVHKSTDASEDLFELSIDDGSNQNIFFINNYNNTLTVAMVNGGSYQFSNNSFNPTEGARYKLAFAYKQNDFALYINGNQIATDSSGTVTTMNQITFGNYYNNQINLSNSVKVNNLKLYNTRLSNSELQALTS